MYPKTIDEFMDTAKSRNGITSDRGLSRALNVTPATTNSWRLKRSWPKDVHIEQLAEMCDIPVSYALMELNAWRTDGTVKTIYERMAQKIAATAAAVLLLISVAVVGVGSPTPANAGTRA